jgi:ribosomal protein S18 acetylase RimI-like enzyme
MGTDSDAQSPVTLRTALRPGDLGEVVRLHGTSYARERGFDPTFEAYVAAPLAEFVRRGAARERLWLAEQGGRLVGCVAVVAAGPQAAQLRWLLVDAPARGRGLGRRLLHEALAFCRACGYAEVLLWTESALTAAARLYRAAGFRQTEERPGRLWGVELVEQKFELRLGDGEGASGVMTHQEALEVLAARRGRHVVITTHGSVDPWVSLSDTALDFAYVPASMGQAPALGLGLALAQPGRGVVVVCGDGHLLMNLGCLVTIAAHPTALYLVVMDNGVYEVTGGQPTPGAGRTDFAGLARTAGVRRVYACATAAAWRAVAGEALSGPGPVVVWLRVAARAGQRAPSAMRPMAEQLARLRGALHGGEAAPEVPGGGPPRSP